MKKVKNVRPPAKIITFYKFFHKIPISTSKYFAFFHFYFRLTYKYTPPKQKLKKARLFCINCFLKEKLLLQEVYFRNKRNKK